MKWVVQPSRLSGFALVPGDKSISHRALMLSALATGTSVIRNLAPGGDVVSTADCLRSLGIQLTKSADATIVTGGDLVAPSVLDAGNSGTTLRLLSGILAACPFTTTITGDDSLRRRPMDRVIEPLTMMGASVTAEGGRAPLVISGGTLTPVDYTTPIPSAQVKSCILMASLGANGTTVVRESVATRDHTERMMESMGIPIDISSHVISVHGPARPHPASITVPGDISSAAFLFVGAALTGSRVTVSGVGVNPTRVGFLDVLRRMQCRVEMTAQGQEGGEPFATVSVSANRLQPVDLTAADVPGAIDELPLVALLATAADGVTSVTGAGELRVKESDRITAVVTELRKLGADITELPDGFRVRGPVPLRGAECSAEGDHRIAMMLALSGLIASGQTVINGADCASVSFPGFLETLRTMGASIDVR